MPLTPPRHNGAACALLFLLGLLLYLPALAHPFHFDDFAGIVHNPFVRHPDGPLYFFTDTRFYLPPDGSQPVHVYRPIPMALYAVALGAAGLNPLVFRLAGWLLHGTLAALVFILGLRIAPAFLSGPAGVRPAAWLAGLLVALHPVASESVIYIWAQSEGLACVGVVGGLVLLLAARDRRGLPAWGMRVASWGLFAGALLSKATAMGFPLIVLATVWVVSGRERWRAALAEATPFLLMVGGWLLLRQHLFGELARPIAPDGRLEYLLTQLDVMPRYLRLVVLPVGLNVHHAVPLSTQLGPLGLLTIVGSGLALALVGLRPGRRHWLWFLLWVGVFLAPSSSLVPLNMKMNERRLYLPLVGVALFAGVWGARWFAALPQGAVRRKAGWLVGAILVLLAGLSLDRAAEWRSGEALWGDSLRQNPAFWVPHQQLGTLAEQARPPRLEEAAHHFQEAARLQPGSWSSWYHLGRVWLALGRPEAAIEAFSNALAVMPGDDGDTRWRLARAYRRAGSPVLAEEHAGRAVLLLPGEPQAWLELARALAGLDRPTEAARAFERLRKVAPPGSPARAEADRYLQDR